MSTPKLGIYEKALSKKISWPERLEIANKLEFDFIEISIDETDERLERLNWNRHERADFVKRQRESNVGVPSMCLSGHRRFPLGSRSPDIRLRALQIMQKAIEFSVDTGIRTIQLAGYDVYYEDGDEETYKWFVENLAKSLELAARENVMLAMEIMDTPLMSSVMSYLNLYKQIPSPWFSLYPDIGNLSAWDNNVREELKMGINHIVAVHLKDTLAVGPNSPGQFKEVDFGDGCVDFPGAFETLLQLKYTGPFVIEMWTEKSSEPVKKVRDARTWILNHMRASGYMDDSH